MQEDPNKITYFAETNSRGTAVPFGIKRRDRARHMYVIGKTGMGKSTLLENMAIQDIRNGEGMAFIDPHGSTADRIMEYVPEHRIKDVLYFAPFDMDYPVAFNVMEDVGYDKRHLVVSGLLSAFRKIWVDAWSARMEYILSNTLLALLEHPGSTLLDVNRMLINKEFRKKVVGYKDKQGNIVYGSVRDPIVLSFWLDEFANYTDRYTQDATPAIQNKVGQFTSNPLIRNIVGQPKSSFDIRQMMDDKKILIMNLSKGRVGEVNATLLGSMLVTKIYLAAMSRADVPAATLATLPNFYFYVDEFQNFANESFSDILSEARKYKLNLIIAHQYIEQMEEEVRDAVFGNVGTTIAFRVGPFDAEVLETIFQPQFTQTDLVNLGFAQIYLTLMIDGVGSPPFSATTLKPFDPTPERFFDRAIEESRATFAKPRVQVEADLAAWSESEAEKQKTSAAPAPARTEAPRRAPAAGGYVTARKPEAHAPLLSDYVRRESARPLQPPHASPEVRHAQAALVGEQVAQSHSVATSRALAEDAPPKPPARPRPAPAHTPRAAAPERPKPAVGGPPPQQPVERPPLEGARTLREALAQAAAHGGGPVQEAVPPARLAPAARPPRHPAPPTPDLKETLKKVAAEHSRPGPAALPDKVLQDMLAVDEVRDGDA